MFLFPLNVNHFLILNNFSPRLICNVVHLSHRLKPHEKEAHRDRCTIIYHLLIITMYGKRTLRVFNQFAQGCLTSLTQLSVAALCSRRLLVENVETLRSNTAHQDPPIELSSLGRATSSLESQTRLQTPYFRALSRQKLGSILAHTTSAATPGQRPQSHVELKTKNIVI